MVKIGWYTIKRGNGPKGGNFGQRRPKKKLYEKRMDVTISRSHISSKDLPRFLATGKARKGGRRKYRRVGMVKARSGWLTGYRRKDTLSSRRKR